jgi:hypothetical protein
VDFQAWQVTYLVTVGDGQVWLSEHL